MGTSATSRLPAAGSGRADSDQPSRRGERSGPEASRRVQRFVRFAVGVLLYVLAVIAFGAWVRISGSGAGCGEHWPTCHGSLVPRGASAQTLIEFSHRLTSGLSGLLVLALPIAAWRVVPSAHPARRWALASLFFVLLEGAIGAGLVLRGWVAQDASVGRAVAVALHLVNTLLLTAALALTARTAARAERLTRAPIQRALPASRRARRLLGLALLAGYAAIAAAGAVTALGDTLMPVGSASERSASAHFLVQLRVVHPLLAAGLSLALIAATRWVAVRLPSLARQAASCAALCAGQVGLGLVNVALGAPGWLQVLHLLWAQALWVGLVGLLWSALMADTDASGRAAD